jgi:pleckstrin homology domain-containing family G member 4
MCFCILLTLLFIFHIAWCFVSERYETHLSEAAQRSHIYQHQISVNSSTSIQTVIYNGAMASGDDLQMNASESLTSILTRSSGESQRQKTLSVSSAEEPLHIADVADLLHPQYAIITGGRSMDTGSPLITFPDHNNFHLLTDRDYQRLIQYLIGVTSLQDADLGFQLIIDRRKNSWAQVKAVLVKVSVSKATNQSPNAINHFPFFRRSSLSFPD